MESAEGAGGVKWALACALGAAGNDQELEEVFLLLDDTSLGRNRAPLINVLGRSRDLRALKKLEQLRTDRSIGADAEFAIQKWLSH